MQNNLNTCRKCGFNNPASVRACRNCNAYLGSRTNYQSFTPPENTNKKAFYKFLPLLLIIPLFFAGKYFLSYGQISVKKMPEELAQITGSPAQNAEKVRMPVGGWYQRSIKSWFWEIPSVEDVLAKDIEVAGGWKALKALDSIEFSAESYSYDCRL